jgi:hypothetical protein
VAMLQSPHLLEPPVAHDGWSGEVGGLQHCHSQHCVLTLVISDTSKGILDTSTIAMVKDSICLIVH